MLNGQLNNYTNKQLSRYTNRQLELLEFLGYIYDRTYQDVQRWRELRDKGWDSMTETERSEWLGETLPSPSPCASKGMYTHNDLNRVESTVENLAVWFREMGYDVPSLTVKLDWSYEDEITKEDMDRYFSNIQTIRDVFDVFPNTPKAPTTNDKFDYLKANDVEKILNDVFGVIDRIIDSWHYAGEIISGEV